MRKILFLLSVLLVAVDSFSQRTEFYKLIKVVKDGKVNTNVVGGQFITFTKTICYESDINGFSVEHGRLEYKYSENGKKVYVGGSYWGSHSVFIFKNDLSALNVQTDDGAIYVYKLRTAPASATTCSLIRKKQQNNYGIPYYAPLPNNGNYVGNDEKTKRGYANSQTTKASRQQSMRHVCPRCNGQKRIVIETFPALYGTADYMIRCNECGGSFLRSTGHAHVSCPQCHGKGYFSTN